MRKDLRIGIVGCGAIAQAHLTGYRKAEGAVLVAVHDVAGAAAEKMAAETGARVAASVEEMVERDQLDAVSVCSPPAAHLDNCRPFLKAGIGVLCEKPIEVDAARAAKLALLTRRSASVFMMAFCHRFHPPILELKALIDGGTLGEALLFRNLFGGYRDLTGNHRADPNVSGGGCLMDHGCHSVDLFRFLVGDPTFVQASIGNVLQKLPIEDFGMIHLGVRGRAFGEITASYSLKGCGNFVEWYGTKGAALVSYWNAGCPDLKVLVEGAAWTAVDCSRHPDRFTGEVRHFLQCVREKGQPAVTATDGLKASRIAQGVYKAARMGRRVALSL